MLGEEDTVTATANPEDMPDWLVFDSLAGKFVFCIEAFPFEEIITTKLGLTEKATVKALSTWEQFNGATTKLIKKFYDKLISKFYQSGISQGLRKSFCSVLASKLPRMANRYRRLRENCFNGSLVLSKTVRGFTFYSVK